MHGAGKQNHDLQLVVNNFVENCIETVDHVANIEEYDQEYDGHYQDKLKGLEQPVCSIYVSELTQLESILRLPERGLTVLYKGIRVGMRYCSMASERIVQHPIF